MRHGISIFSSLFRHANTVHSSMKILYYVYYGIFNSPIIYSLLPFGLIWLIYTCALRGLLSEFSFTSNIAGAAWNFISSS